MKFSIDDNELGNIMSAPTIAQAGHDTKSSYSMDVDMVKSSGRK